MKYKNQKEKEKNNTNKKEQNQLSKSIIQFKLQIKNKSKSISKIKLQRIRTQSNFQTIKAYLITSIVNAQGNMSEVVEFPCAMGSNGFNHLAVRCKIYAGEELTDQNSSYLLKARNVCTKYQKAKSAAGRARTSDFKIFSLALSQLSYCGVMSRVNTNSLLIFAFYCIYKLRI